MGAKLPKPLQRPEASEMCPPGSHLVRAHERICQSGTRTWVDTHTRRNRGGQQAMLLKENILWLYWKYSDKYKKLKSVHGFPNENEFDAAIQFWMEFWLLQGLKFSDYDPLLIKTLIAIESSFNPVAAPKVKGSTAFGLMQITNQTMRILAGIPNRDGYRELKPPYIQISRADAADPIVNIAAGTRWLFYKHTKLPKGAERTTKNVFKNYYGWGKDGDAYAERIYELYKKSR